MNQTNINQTTLEPIVFIILARGNSKRVKKKNLYKLGYTSLIKRTIDVANATGLAKKIIVSSDDQEILDHVADCDNVELVVRPAELAQDDSLSIDAQIHALQVTNITDHQPVMMLQCTSPLRKPIHIIEALQQLMLQKEGSVISGYQAPVHPYKSLILDQEANQVNPIIDLDALEAPKQKLPIAYNLNGAIYLNYADDIIKANRYFIHPIGIYEMDNVSSLDIDNYSDIEQALKSIND